MHKHRVRVGNRRARKPEERELQLAAALHSRTRQTKPGQRQIRFEFHRVRLLRSQRAGRRVKGLHPEPGHKVVIGFLTASLQPFARKAIRVIQRTGRKEKPNVRIRIAQVRQLRSGRSRTEFWQRRRRHGFHRHRRAVVIIKSRVRQVERNHLIRPRSPDKIVTHRAPIRTLAVARVEVIIGEGQKRNSDEGCVRKTAPDIAPPTRGSQTAQAGCCKQAYAGHCHQRIVLCKHRAVKRNQPQQQRRTRSQSQHPGCSRNCAPQQYHTATNQQRSQHQRTNCLAHLRCTGTRLPGAEDRQQAPQHFQAARRADPAFRMADQERRNIRQPRQLGERDARTHPQPRAPARPRLRRQNQRQ